MSSTKIMLYFPDSLDLQISMHDSTASMEKTAPETTPTPAPRSMPLSVDIPMNAPMKTPTNEPTTAKTQVSSAQTVHPAAEAAAAPQPPHALHSLSRQHPDAAAAAAAAEEEGEGEGMAE